MTQQTGKASYKVLKPLSPAEREHNNKTSRKRRKRSLLQRLQDQIIFDTSRLDKEERLHASRSRDEAVERIRVTRNLDTLALLAELRSEETDNDQ